MGNEKKRSQNIPFQQPMWPNLAANLSKTKTTQGKSMTKLTVGMPVYNDEPYVKAAIDSILSQSFCDFKLLIVDDGSTDKSSKIISSYADKRIEYIRHHQNLGRPVARNTALNAADSEYFAWMDSDDIACPDRFAKQIQFLDTHPKISICGGRVRRFHGAKGISSQTNSPAIAAMTIFSPALYNPTVMMRLSDVRKADLQYDSSLKRAEDFAFWIEAFLRQKLQGFVLPDILLNYRVFNRPSNSYWHQLVVEKYLIPLLGLSCTASEIAIHTGVGTGDFRDIIHRFGVTAVFEWFDRLYKQCAAILDFPIYLAHILQNYSEYCITHSPNMLKNIKIYHQYTFSRKKNPCVLYSFFFAKYIKHMLKELFT